LPTFFKISSLLKKKKSKLILGHVQLYYSHLPPPGVACETRCDYGSSIFSDRRSNCGGLQTPRGGHVLLTRCYYDVHVPLLALEVLRFYLVKLYSFDYGNYNELETKWSVGVTT